MGELRRWKVVVTQRFFDDAALAFLEANRCDVHLVDLPEGTADRNVALETLTGWLDGADGWIVGHARVNRDLLAALPELQVIARRGVGYERVDLAAVRDLGRVATIAAGGNAETVADQTVGMMLAVGRRFREGQATINRGAWDIPVGTDLYAKTVGVVGLGRIGRAVVRRLGAFSANIIVHTPRPDPTVEASGQLEYVGLEPLLSRSDYLTLHAPLTPDTRFLIRDTTLAQMKSSAFVVNTARGGLVEDRHLLEALQRGDLAGAALDVFVSESDPAYRDVTAELASLPNVVAAPHSGASTAEALARTNRIAAQCVVGVLRGTSLPEGCVVADGRPTPEGEARGIER